MEQRRCLRIGGPGRALRRARPARTVQVAVVPAGAGALCLAGPESVYIPMPSTRSIPALAVLAASMFALSSCSAAGSLLHRSSKKMPETDESFSVSNNYSQTFDVSAAWACEAARRALLSQAYVVAHADADSVEAAKNFQPTVDVHEQVQVHVSCVSKDDGHAWMFVSALAKATLASLPCPSGAHTTRNSICTWCCASGWKYLRAVTSCAVAAVTT